MIYMFLSNNSSGYKFVEFVLLYLDCISTNVLYAATYHTTLSKKKFLLLEMNQNIQGLPACIVLLTMFV